MTKPELIAYFDATATSRDAWKKRNWYYHEALEKLAHFLIPESQSVCEMGAGTGDLLAYLKPVRGLGIDMSPRMLEIAAKKYPNLEWEAGDAEDFVGGEKFDYIVISDLVGYVDDVEKIFTNLQKICHSSTQVVITHYNYLWEPVFRLAELLGLKQRQPLQNWLSGKDFENLLYLGGFEVIKSGNKMVFPVHLPFLSSLMNRYIGNLPLIRSLGIIQYYVARPMPKDPGREYGVSVIIPCRNEKGNIEQAILRMPHFGSSQEIIFVEGHSDDDTLGEVKRVSREYAAKKNIRWTVQDGKGKGDAVRKGFAMAQGEILMILDADLTVPPEDLPKFYEAIRSGRGQFINGSRLVYQMEKQAMRFLNMLANRFFGIMFSWLLGQRLKDTLCGTKVLFKKDYERVAAGRAYFGDFDPFGDFDLIFGAAKLNLKIVEMPVRYAARTYGSTNIQRWRHGWILLKMVVFAMRKIKFI